MQDELSRLMNGLFEGNGRPTQSWVPTLDAWETESELVYAFDLPGIGQKGDLGRARRRARSRSRPSAPDPRSPTSTSTVSSAATASSRPVALPQGVLEEAIKASYREGVLEIRVPRPEQARPRKIEVAVGAAVPATVEGTSKAA